jgi:glycosyltransferase involved in cell wall biosynthesis
MNTSIRVCVVDEEGRYGGPERRIIQIASEILKFNVHTHVIIPKLDSNFFKKELDKKSTPFTSINLTRLSLQPKIFIRYCILFPFEVVNLTLILKKEKFDLIHINGAYQFKSAIAAYLSNTPVIWHLNDTYSPLILKKIFNKISPVLSDGFIVAGEKVYDYYLKDSKQSNFPIKEVHAPVDISTFNPMRYKKAESDTYKIGVASSVNPAKGLEYFVKVARILVECHDNIEFVVAGSILGSQSKYFKCILNIVDNTPLLKKKIKFIGHVKNVPEFLSTLDLCLFTSVTEASPTAIWEAMAMSKPIVTTRVGSVEQYIQHGKSGLIADVGDVEKLAHYVNHLIDRPDESLIMGRAARVIATKELGVQLASEKHNIIYRAVIKNTNIS